MKSKTHRFFKKNLTDGSHEDVSSVEVSKEVSMLSKEREKEIERELSVIYENNDGSLPNMTAFEAAPHRGVFRAIMTLVFVCACFVAVAWFGFVVFAPKIGFDESRVHLAVSGEIEARIGEEVHYHVRYENTDASPLAQAKLEVRFPEGFVLTKSSIPPTAEGNAWDVGTIAPGARGVVDVSGRIYGAYGESRSVRAFLTYLPATFSSPFQKVATLVTTLVESPVSIAVSVPGDVSPGSEVPLSFRIRQSAGISIPSLRVELLSDAVRIVSSDKKPDEALGVRWTVPTNTEEYVISAKAMFTQVKDDGSVPLQARVVGWNDIARSTDPFVVTTTQQIVTLIDTALRTTLVVNGATGPVTVTPGETLHASLLVKNTGDSPMTNATIRLVFDAPSYKNRSMLNWPQVDDALDGVILGEQLSSTKRRGSITWNAKQIPALASLKQGDEVAISVNLPLKDTRDPDLANYPTGPITITPEVRYASLGTQQIFSGDTRTLPVVSNVSLTTDVDATSRGVATDYKIKWIVKNEFHDLKDLKLEADIYGDIVWSPSLLSVPAGTVTFDEQTKKLTWLIPSMPESVDVNALQFGFTLKEKNPTQTQLVSKVRFTSTDTTANEQVVRVGDELTFGVSE